MEIHKKIPRKIIAGAAAGASAAGLTAAAASGDVGTTIIKPSKTAVESFAQQASDFQRSISDQIRTATTHSFPMPTGSIQEGIQAVKKSVESALTTPETYPIGKHIAVDFETGKIRAYDGQVQITEKPNVIEVKFRGAPRVHDPENTDMVVHLGSPTTAAPEFERLVTAPTSQNKDSAIKVQYGTPVLGSTTGHSPEYTTTVNGKKVEAKYSAWIRLTDRFGNSVGPFGEAILDQNGKPQDYFVAYTQVADTKPLQGYAAPGINQ